MNITSLLVFSLLIFPFSGNLYAGVKAKVEVIIEKLPPDKEEKMKDFHRTIQEYVKGVQWLEEDDEMPIEISFQLFLNEKKSSFEDRYRCDFLISCNDVQYFDKRVFFPYDPSDQLIYNEQSVEPLTGVLNFYINMILGNELDKFRNFGGDVYYKRALNFAAIGKFVRTDFIFGSTEREELVKRIFVEPFITFRTMKDYYFYGLFVLQNDKKVQEARDNIKKAIELLDKVFQITPTSKIELTEPKQFLDAHYVEIIDLYKDYVDRDEILKTLMRLDPERKEQYEESLTGS